MRPRAGPIIVSWTSSASRCLLNGELIGVMTSLPGRLRRPDLDPAGYAARMAAQQPDHDLGDVLRRRLPAGTLGFAAIVERGRDRSGQYVTDANAVVAQLLHQRFAELVEASLGRAVGRCVRERVAAGKA